MCLTASASEASVYCVLDISNIVLMIYNYIEDYRILDITCRVDMLKVKVIVIILLYNRENAIG